MLNCAVALYYFILQFYVWRHAPSLIVFVTHRAKFERCMFEVRIEVRYDGRPPMKAASLGGESGGIKLCTWCMILHNIMYNAMRTIKLSTTVCMIICVIPCAHTVVIGIFPGVVARTWYVFPDECIVLCAEYYTMHDPA